MNSRIVVGGKPLAVGAFLACVAGVVAGVVVAASGEASEEGFLTVACLPSAAFGVLVALKQPRNPIGWILLAIAFFFSVQLITGSYLEAHPDEPNADDVVAAAWLAGWAWIPAIVLGGAFLPLLFPNGRLFSPRWRYVAGVALAAIVVNFLSAVLKPGPLDPDVRAINPTGIPGLGDFFEVTTGLGGVLVVGAFFAAGYSQVLRFRRAEGDEREQLKWFAYIGSLIGLGMLFAFLSTLIHTDWMAVAGDIGWLVGALSLGVGLPAAVGIAILRYRLYDIDWIINRTLVYVPLTALLAGVYIAMTGTFRTLLANSTGETSDAAVAFTTLVVVAMLTPAKNYMQETVDAHFKESRDPARRLEKLGHEARSAAELVDRSLFVQRYLDSTVEALDSRGGSVRLEVGWQREFVCKECELPAAVSMTISHAGMELGVIEVSQRRNGRPYSQAEVEALRHSLESVAYFVSVDGVAKAARPRAASR